MTFEGSVRRSPPGIESAKQGTDAVEARTSAARRNRRIIESPLKL